MFQGAPPKDLEDSHGLVFADDAKENRPSRERMGPLVTAGAILVNGDRLTDLESSIEKLCKKNGFPFDDPKISEFKWSDDRATADHRWPSAHHPARHTTRANPPRHLSRAAGARTNPFANQAMDPK